MIDQDVPLVYWQVQGDLGPAGTTQVPLGDTSIRAGETPETWVGGRASWGAALLGALPFLLFGLVHLLKGLAELGGYNLPTLPLGEYTPPQGGLSRPAVVLTLTMGVYFACLLGLLYGIMKSFPRWSYTYLGMSLYFGWDYSSGSFYGVHYGWWGWIPLFVTFFLGLLLVRSLAPLARLIKGVWHDWSRLSLAMYAGALPLLTVVFFDDDWGIPQLYGLAFDSLLLAAGAVAFLRLRSTWGRLLSLLIALLILLLRNFQGGWYWPAFFFILTLFGGLVLLPGVLGVLKWGVERWSSR